MQTKATSNFFNTQVLGHPAGLFILFFTEMWERFSFYGMRVLLVNFLTMSLIGYNPGWEWATQNATALYGTYAMLLYLTPILGGIIADRITGYRWAVIIGAIIMTLGHLSMAFETELSLYIGLGLLVLGTGFFKPNMVSMVSQMYKYLPEKKDAAYTIFYMGVNSGAFFGMLLCGYLAEKIGWAWGFGLAGIFMFLGTLQFYFSQSFFGEIGAIPSKEKKHISTEKTISASENTSEEKANPFTLTDKILTGIAVLIGLAYAINDPLSRIAHTDIFKWLSIHSIKGQYIAILIGLAVFLFLVISRISRYTQVVRHRMIAFIIFASFVVFFSMSFEQGASSLIIVARDFVNRSLSGNAALLYNVVNTLLTVVPLAIISVVLIILGRKTFRIIPVATLFLLTCFVSIWGVMGWMLYRDWASTSYEVSYQAVKTPIIDAKTGLSVKDEAGKQVFKYTPITQDYQVQPNDIIVQQITQVADLNTFSKGDQVEIIAKNSGNTSFGFLSSEKKKEMTEKANALQRSNGIISAQIHEIKNNQVEITVSWFSILNSFFVIALASLFSKIWDSRFNPIAPIKYALGFVLLACGFGLLAYATHGIYDGVKISMLWLVAVYFFNTMGELCMSPVGLSYVSKLVPQRMIALMFGMWYLALAIGNKLAAMLGGQIENITKEYSLSTFFLIFTIVPLLAALLIFLLRNVLLKLMHGIK